MSWLEKFFREIVEQARNVIFQKGYGLNESCDAVLYRADLNHHLEVCPKCSHHMRISARKRLQSFLDPVDTQELGQEFERKIF